jgi:hypothetical protein
VTRSIALTAELAKDPHRTFRRVMYGLCGDNPHSDPPVEPFVPPGNGFLDLFEDPEELPSWLAEADIDTLATEFTEAWVHQRSQLVPQLAADRPVGGRAVPDARPLRHRRP